MRIWRICSAMAWPQKDALCANVTSAAHLNKENNAWRLTEDPGEAFCGTNVVVHIMVVEATVA